MSRSPPLRFLILLLAGWTGLRTAWLAPDWESEPAEAGGAPRTDRLGPSKPAARPQLQTAAAPATRKSLHRPAPVSSGLRPRGEAASPPGAPLWPMLTWQLAAQNRNEHRVARAAARSETSRGSPATPRWSFAAWSFLRRGDAPALAPGGTLGGSQAGALARFRINGEPDRPLALAIRLSSPVRRPAGAEAAVGIDWRPSRRLPIHLLAERREALGSEGRSAFGLTLHGGVSDAPIAGLRVEAYAQAGIVGMRSRDRFGDGALRLSVPLGRMRLGAGAWAAAQPGLSRLDLGPQASLRLPLAGRNVAIAADWRFRVAGNARPGSGPALTVGTDF